MTCTWTNRIVAAARRTSLALAIAGVVPSASTAGDDSLRGRQCCAGLATPPAPTTQNTPQRAAPGVEPSKLPPLPAGVVELKLADAFKTPVGPRGLEYSDRVRKLDGKRVRIHGHMVRQCDPRPGKLLLALRPVILHEHEYGLCDELPPATVHVSLPAADAGTLVPFTPGPMLLTGTLSLGLRPEADGRISVLRLTLDAPSAPESKDPPAVVPQQAQTTSPQTRTLDTRN